MLQSLALKKAKITQVDPAGKTLTVLFNPAKYSVERRVTYAQHDIQGLDLPLMQFEHGSADTLTMQLFFDTYSGGLAAGGTVDSAKLLGSSLAPEAAKTDVRDYTEKLYRMMSVIGDRHAPPMVKFEWGSFSFQGYITAISEQFTMFAYDGTPLRATLDVTFVKQMTPREQLRAQPRNSPDRTKFYTLRQGDTLAMLALREYGDAGLWREIARANRMENPRLLETGVTIRIPALL